MGDRKWFSALYYALQWTWGLPQNLVGLGMYLACGKAPREMFRGAAVTRWKLDRGSAGVGMFLFLSPWAGRKTLAHEYGHSIQSLILGPLFLPVIGLPSLLWAGLKPAQAYRRKKGISYDSFYPERWANALGRKFTEERN